MDRDGSGNVTFAEFVRFVLKFNAMRKQRPTTPHEEGHGGTQGQILRHALATLGTGTVIVLLFSDPMCGVLNVLGSRTGIPAFYISFVVAPLASNGSEILAAYNFASRKTVQSISVSFNTLLGAANMNNTFCLGIFCAIIAVSPAEKGIYWEFAAETITICVAEILMFIMAMKGTHRLMDACIVLAIYPCAIGMVAGLEAAGLN